MSNNYRNIGKKNISIVYQKLFRILGAQILLSSTISEIRIRGIFAGGSGSFWIRIHLKIQYNSKFNLNKNTSDICISELWSHIVKTMQFIYLFMNITSVNRIPEFGRYIFENCAIEHNKDENERER